MTTVRCSCSGSRTGRPRTCAVRQIHVLRRRQAARVRGHSCRFCAARWHERTCSSTNCTAASHAQLADARTDAAHLKDAVLVDACWNLFEWILRFDCGTSLCVWIDRSKICWRLKPSESVSIGDDYQRVGAAPVVFDLSGAVGLSKMDCSSLVSSRRGARFKDLFVADYGLLIYLHGHLIL